MHVHDCLAVWMRQTIQGNVVKLADIGLISIF